MGRPCRRNVLISKTHIVLRLASEVCGEMKICQCRGQCDEENLNGRKNTNLAFPHALVCKKPSQLRFNVLNLEILKISTDSTFSYSMNRTAQSWPDKNGAKKRAVAFRGEVMRLPKEGEVPTHERRRRERCKARTLADDNGKRARASQKLNWRCAIVRSSRKGGDNKRKTRVKHRT